MSWELVGQISVLVVIVWIPVDQLIDKFIKHDASMRNQGVKK